MTGKSTIDEIKPYAENLYSQSLTENYTALTPDEPNAFWPIGALDLKWTATFSFEYGEYRTFVITVSDSFDMTRFISLLKTRNYSINQYKGVTLYSHPYPYPHPDTKPEDHNRKSYENSEWDQNNFWLSGQTHFANIGILAQSRTLLISQNIENVHAALDAHAGRKHSLLDDKAALSMATRLGNFTASALRMGQKVCPYSLAEVAKGFDEIKVMQPELRENTLRRLGMGMGIHTYSALGVGYGLINAQPRSDVIMHYERASEAQADLKPRREAAKTGDSVSTNQIRPFTEFFLLEGAEVVESDLIIHLKPVTKRLSIAFNLLESKDLMFAACP